METHLFLGLRDAFRLRLTDLRELRERDRYDTNLDKDLREKDASDKLVSDGQIERHCTPLLNLDGQNDKSRDQRSGILHIVRDP